MSEGEDMTQDETQTGQAPRWEAVAVGVPWWLQRGREQLAGDEAAAYLNRIEDLAALAREMREPLEQAGRRYCVKDRGHEEPCSADVPQLMMGQRQCGAPVANKHCDLLAHYDALQAGPS